MIYSLHCILWLVYRFEMKNNRTFSLGFRVRERMLHAGITHIHSIGVLSTGAESGLDSEGWYY